MGRDTGIEDHTLYNFGRPWQFCGGGELSPTTATFSNALLPPPIFDIYKSIIQPLPIRMSLVIQDHPFRQYAIFRISLFTFLYIRNSPTPLWSIWKCSFTWLMHSTKAAAKYIFLCKIPSSLLPIFLLSLVSLLLFKFFFFFSLPFPLFVSSLL